MSRVAKKAVVLPQGVSVEASDAVYVVKGKLGSVEVPRFAKLTLNISNDNVALEQDEGYKADAAKAGLLRSLLNNAVEGVTNGFTKVLELKGLGYRCKLEGKKLVMSLGYSHPVIFPIPEDVTITVEKDITITIKGVNKQRVGQVAADIRSKKIPDNYHAKGILFQGEVVMTKEGKKK